LAFWRIDIWSHLSAPTAVPGFRYAHPGYMPPLFEANCGWKSFRLATHGTEIAVSIFSRDGLLLMAEVIEANLADPAHARAVVDLLDRYAQEPEGGGAALSGQVRRNLIPAMQRRHDALILLAMQDGEGIGLLNAFEGFSTFAAAPLLNIHDVYVVPARRGTGIGRALFEYAERAALRRGCSKMTLEVLSGNMRAQRLYRALGFEAYALDEPMGHALFWQKKLP
jgi:GNAT superfamily N-acetyltransferase